MSKDIHNYDDIINIPRPVSKSHKPMSRTQRAAQFAPFAALKGYDESINETSRIVDKEIELSEEELDNLRLKLNYLNEHIKEKIEIKVTYFVPDNKKQGGSYQTKTEALRRMDDIEGNIEFTDRTKIKINKIIKIEADCFNEYEVS